MGACYSVTLKVDIVDEPGVVAALNKHMVNDSRTVYNTGGVAANTFNGLMRSLLADHQHKVTIWQTGEFRCYENDFNASYGWEGVMLDWFEIMAPFLGNCSTLLIYPDSDYDEVTIKDGKCLYIH